MNDFKVFIPFAKKNNDEYIVEGVASSEELDSQGEVVKFDGIKKALPEYMKFGNIREMHQFSAVGKAIKAVPDEENKLLYLVAKIVDKQAWEKVKEGVYNGFSIGGRVLKQVENEIHELTLNEISLVDRPANPAAVFSLVKFDKGGEMEKMDEDGMVAQEEPKHDEVYEASYLLSLAKELCYYFETLQYKGQNTMQVEKAIQLLKQLAMDTLANDNSEDKAKLDKYISDFEAKNDLHLPVEKKELTDAEKEALKVQKFEEVKSYFKSDAWVGNYFDTQRKILG